jgi:hypothetical protein
LKLCYLSPLTPVAPLLISRTAHSVLLEWGTSCTIDSSHLRLSQECGEQEGSGAGWGIPVREQMYWVVACGGAWRLRLRLMLIVFVFVFLLPLPIFFHHLADVVPGVAWHEQVFPRTNVLHQATICRAVRGTAASVRQRIGQWQCLEWWVVVERVDCGQWGC